MINAVILAIIMVVVFVAIRTIIKSKAKGQKCVGCPSCGCCSKHCTTDNQKESSVKS